jgi:glycerol dehydrogenase
VDALIAVGGGKCVDTGKSVAYRLGVPLIVVPTLASNDAPCSALSVVYTPEGVSSDVEFFPENPAMVVVDTAVVAAAADRYLVAGMGDAMATWYEARATAANPNGIAAIGGRPTLTGTALGKLCAETLYRQGVAAAEAVMKSSVNDALEEIVEANTLLSGLGFESGGLAVAHAMAQGYTVVESVEENNLHGEMVAMGVLAQLVLEQDADEAHKVANFFREVGLPIHLGQIGLSTDQSTNIEAVIAAAMDFPFLMNMPFEVKAEGLHQAVLAAHDLGLGIARGSGESAWRRLRQS